MEKKEVIKKTPWWAIILIILLGVWLLSDLGSNDEYKSCVDECVSDMNWCAEQSYVMGNANWYLADYDFEDCQNELEYCITSCEP